MILQLKFLKINVDWKAWIRKSVSPARSIKQKTLIESINFVIGFIVILKLLRKPDINWLSILNLFVLKFQTKIYYSAMYVNFVRMQQRHFLICKEFLSNYIVLLSRDEHLTWKCCLKMIKIWD